MRYYTDNKTTRFVTKLPCHIELSGKWSVSLMKIQIPLTFQHVPKSRDQRKIVIVTYDKLGKEARSVLLERFYIEQGLYRDISTLLTKINVLCSCQYIVFDLKPNQYVQVQKKCQEKRALVLAPALKRILGMD